ncbi:MAG TPA: acyl carrier protein, partial [Pyrinomonadaceae bacterium]|nr:acyl carrier protein [Pyrinomonadaceae bacterium]
VEWEQLAQRNPQVRDKKWAHYLVRSASKEEGKASIHPEEFLIKLLKVPPRQRREQLVQLVREQVMIVMGLTPSSPIELRRGLWDMGLDSLMALELKSRLEVGLGRSIPATVAFEFPTIEAIANYLDGEIFQLEHHVAPNGQHGNGNADPTASALEKIQQLSDEEVERLFNERISKGNS